MIVGKRKVMSPAKLFAAPTSESARLSGEKSAQIRSSAVRRQVWPLQSPKVTARSRGFFESNQGDRLQCKTHHSFQARYERRSGNLALQFGADDDAVLAMDPETIGKMSPLIQPAKDNARHRNSPSAVAEHCRDWQPSAQSGGFDRVIVRCQESFCRAGAARAHKETNPRRSQDRRAMALCVQRSFPDRAAV